MNKPYGDDFDITIHSDFIEILLGDMPLKEQLSTIFGVEVELEEKENENG